MSTARTLQRLLEQIAETAYEASGYASQLRLLERPKASLSDAQICIPKQLPVSLQDQAVKLAIKQRSDNAPNLSVLASLCGDSQIVERDIYSLGTSRFWESDRKEFTVSFVGDFSSRLQSRILEGMNGWRTSEKAWFVPADQIGDVRISCEATGNWSFVGADISCLPIHQPTTNFDGLTTETPEQEFCCIVQHQAGHLLGFGHRPLDEQQKTMVNREAVHQYLRRILGWRSSVIEALVFDAKSPPIKQALQMPPTVMGWQFPGACCKSGHSIDSYALISQQDLALVAKMYGH